MKGHPLFIFPFSSEQSALSVHLEAGQFYKINNLVSAKCRETNNFTLKISDSTQFIR